MKNSLTKTDLRILCAKLKILEKELHFSVKAISRKEDKISKTQYANIERRVRLKLNALELLKLHLTTIKSTTDVQIPRQKKNTGYRETCTNVKGSIAKIKATI